MVQLVDILPLKNFESKKFRFDPRLPPQINKKNNKIKNDYLHRKGQTQIKVSYV